MGGALLVYSTLANSEILTYIKPILARCLIREYLKNSGFKVEAITVTGELQDKVEQSYTEWCVEVGVPRERFTSKKHRFFTLLEWVKEEPETRERLVKTDWPKWKLKWRITIFTNRNTKLNEYY